jgi:phage gp36-like protein
MSQFVISEFYVSPSVVLIDDVKDFYYNSNESNESNISSVWMKAMCKNKESFLFLKDKIKKWLPVHFKWLSSHCSDIDFLRKNENKIDYKELSKNLSINYLHDILERNIDLLDWKELSRNISAVSFMKKYRDKINWDYACMNESKEMVEFLFENRKNIHWGFLSGNPSAVYRLKDNLKKVDVLMLNTNPNAVEILEDNPEFIDYNALCDNRSEKAMKLVEKNINHPDISFEYLSSNPYAIDILKRYPEKIDWGMAIDNENVGELFKSFPEKINMYLKYCLKYPSVLPILKDYLYDISFIKLAQNPGIFKKDDKEYKKNLKSIQNIISKFKM